MGRDNRPSAEWPEPTGCYNDGTMSGADVATLCTGVAPHVALGRPPPVDDARCLAPVVEA